MDNQYDVIIIGGGIAGLQAAIQLGRYKHRIAVIDSNDGRSTICRNYHNILGWPDGVSGETLRNLGKMHAERYGVSFIQNEVVNIDKNQDTFQLQCRGGDAFLAKRLLLATGVKDNIPAIKNIYKCLGLTVYVCPDCDGYEVVDKHVIVIGSGKTGANMALTLSYFTRNITFINHDWSNLDHEVMLKLEEKEITHIQDEVEEILLDEKTSDFKGVRLKSGKIMEGERGFLAFGGNEVRSELATQLGIERLENKHIVVDPRTKMTNIKHVWAAGDIAVHSEQTTIAMGDGMQAAIWIHKSLLDEKTSE
ncbi:NAD(P)/FAD-dependent oxidoreductase [Bacillus timonensis]|uniref:NAD(P)/FAD-dependent oxidoreductase n=1 Tax=Bacillus timonensis TaxID=1033734 RepID=A0A4S3PVR1_9BACI|nr:NAD(P)/FAD-dependent oxidoreductase [Bacillus timonensis]THE13624.1 NAD(P)/FAD-dependent oxidoreductase [Bacillus timonensis]